MEKVKRKLLIFDLDDTLIDTWGAFFPTLTNQAIQEMADQGLKLASLEAAQKRLGEINNYSKNGNAAIKVFLNEIKADQKFLEFGKKGFYNFNFKYDINLLPGVEDIFNNLDADFILVSKGDKDSQLEKLRKSKLKEENFIKIMIVPDYDKTEPYKKILDEQGYSPQDCYVIGDRYEMDLIPAKKLGMKTICILWGRGKISPPKEGEVDFIVKDLKEIIKIINEENEYLDNIK